MNNPLLNPGALPAFNHITTDMIRPAIERIIDDNRQRVIQLVASEGITWEGLVQPLSLLEDRLSKAWSPVRHLNSVKSSDLLRDAYNECLPLLSEYTTEMSQNRYLYQAYQKIANSDNFSQLSEAQQKAINDSLKHFKLGGVDLEGVDKERYQQLQKDLSELQSNFENNVLDSTQSWEILISDEQED